MTKSGSILIVDDEDAIRAVAAQLLRDCGYQVLEATDGLEALAMIDGHWEEITNVICDRTMPGLDGAELVRRAAPRIPADRFFIRSGFDNRARG